jgi:hypothetical protein
MGVMDAVGDSEMEDTVFPLTSGSDCLLYVVLLALDSVFGCEAPSEPKNFRDFVEKLSSFERLGPSDQTVIEQGES